MGTWSPMTPRSSSQVRSGSSSVSAVTVTVLEGQCGISTAHISNQSFFDPLLSTQSAE